MAECVTVRRNKDEVMDDLRAWCLVVFDWPDRQPGLGTTLTLQRSLERVRDLARDALYDLGEE